MNLLSQLNKLDLPPDSFALFGSAPMAVRGIRESKDLDVIIRMATWRKLAQKHPPQSQKPHCIKIGDLELFNNWEPWFKNSDELIDTADVIDGIRYVKLDYVIRWKKAMGREKDLKDIQLIEQYLKNHPHD
jgi:hypothetical protein